MRSVRQTSGAASTDAVTHFGSLEATDVKRLRQLEQENGRLKKMVGDACAGTWRWACPSPRGLRRSVPAAGTLLRALHRCARSTWPVSRFPCHVIYLEWEGVIRILFAHDSHEPGF
jgi:hypothetical protein